MNAGLSHSLSLRRHGSLAVLVLVLVTRITALAAPPLTSEFSYQGALTAGGSAVDEPCDFEFQLFDEAVGGTQIGVTETRLAVGVDDGRFQVQLDFGAGAFTGEARWLAISVRRPAGSGAYVLLTPRQPVLAAPHAVFAMQAPWAGLLGVPAGFADGIDDLQLPYAGTIDDPGTAFSVSNTGAGRAIEAFSNGGIAIQALAPGNGLAFLGLGAVLGSVGGGFDGAYGVRGEATNAIGGVTFGVDGETRSPDGGASGVRGVATSATGITNGVLGRTLSATNGAAGVSGIAPNAAGGTTYGVSGVTQSANTGAAGVFGNAANAAGAETYGVHGVTQASTANASGVRGHAPAATGATNGVWGQCDSTTAFAAGVYGTATAMVTLGRTFGVFGETVADAVGSAGVSGTASNVLPLGATYGVIGRNFSDVATARGAVGFAQSVAAVLNIGVQGQTNSAGAFSAGVYGLAFNAGAFRTYGVRGQTSATLDAAAGVLAQGNGVLGPGMPSAAALEINNGAIRVSGPVRPAGTICPEAVFWEPIESCSTSICQQGFPPHNHTIGWYTDIPFANPLIIDDFDCPPGGIASMIQVSVETELPPPPWTSWYVQVHSKAPGAAVVRVTRMGSVLCGCTPPTEDFRVHYLIINREAGGMALTGETTTGVAPPAESIEALESPGK